MLSIVIILLIIWAISIPLRKSESPRVKYYGINWYAWAIPVLQLIAGIGCFKTLTEVPMKSVMGAKSLFYGIFGDLGEYAQYATEFADNNIAFPQELMDALSPAYSWAWASMISATIALLFIVLTLYKQKYPLAVYLVILSISGILCSIAIGTSTETLNKVIKEFWLGEINVVGHDPEGMGWVSGIGALLINGLLISLFIRNKKLIYSGEGTTSVKTSPVADVNKVQTSNVAMSKIEQLKELKSLLDEGFITQEDFDQQKAKIINQ